MTKKWLPGEEAFVRALRAVVDADARSASQPEAAKNIAEALGVRYRQYREWINGESRFPAAAVPIICTMGRNYLPLDVLETAAGRAAVPLNPRLSTPDAREALLLWKEVGSVQVRLSDALMDDIVTAEALRNINKEIDDVIQRCLAIKGRMLARFQAALDAGSDGASAGFHVRL